MRLPTLLLLTFVWIGLSSCDTSQPRSAGSSAISPVADSNGDRAVESEQAKFVRERGESTPSQNVSLNQADSANAASQAIARKIIRNGNLTLEVSSPAATQTRIFSIAEARGGFVVTSEMSQQAGEDKSKPAQSVNLIIRVPALQFDYAMEEIRGAATRVLQEKRTGQDVTEEFIDLEARLKNQRALEGQFLEIMKRAGKVEEALDVQTQLADVRTEIEKIEGRKRFLESQASLSTINVTLQTQMLIVNTTGFWFSVRSAFSEGVDAASAIILFLIRAIVALLPILVLIVLPAAIVAKIVWKRFRGRRQIQEEVEAT